MKSVGIALGGGGAKGLAHIAILETLDQMGVTISAIAGTSIGAIIGTAYAAGKSGVEIRKSIEALLQRPRSIKEVLETKRLFGWFDLLDIEFGKSHLLQADTFISKMSDYVAVDVFEDLKIPLKVVAADFWQRQEVVFESGPLFPAVSASFCLPGVFEPVVIDDRVLVDGGCVNPVPFDLLQDACDLVIAVDVVGRRIPDDDLLPSYSEALFNTFQIASATIAREKMKRNPADIYLAPAITNVKVLEFDKYEQIYAQTKPECDRLVAELARLVD